MLVGFPLFFISGDQWSPSKYAGLVLLCITGAVVLMLFAVLMIGSFCRHDEPTPEETPS